MEWPIFWEIYFSQSEFGLPKVLCSRIVTRLRALIVLPTRDLVAQVRETIEVLSKGTKLKVHNVAFILAVSILTSFQVGTATGQSSFAQEQSQLIQDQSTEQVKLSFTPKFCSNSLL